MNQRVVIVLVSVVVALGLAAGVYALYQYYYSDQVVEETTQPDKGTAVATYKQRLEALQGLVSGFEAEVEPALTNAEVALQEEWREGIRAVYAAMNTAEEKVIELENASEASWKQFQAGVEASVVDATTLFETLRADMRAKLNPLS